MADWTVKRRAWILMVALAAALWGASYMFIKVALDDGVGEPFIVFAAHRSSGPRCSSRSALRAGRAAPDPRERRRPTLVARR